MPLDKSKGSEEESPFDHIDVQIERKGQKIVLPNSPSPMTTQDAIKHLYRHMEDEITQVEVSETIEAFPFDGAYAFMRAMAQTYGWSTPVPTPSFWGPRKPQVINLEIGHQKYTQIIWGSFTLPGIDGRLETGYARSKNRWIFRIGGSVQKKHLKQIKDLAELTRQILKTDSVYKGQAIRLNMNDEGKIDFDTQPEFLDLERVAVDELIFSDAVWDQVNTNLFTPIEKTDMCRRMKIPLKRGILLGGAYGTGKTLTANVTALKCTQNNWTFIMIDNVKALKEALTFARMYEPAVVFAEDIDRAASGEERTTAIDDILNTIDGVTSKNTEIVTVLTSNHEERINRAMLRPGRLDAVLRIEAPDAKAVARLIQLYARNQLASGEDLQIVGNLLEGQIPAVIREVVERAKLYAIGREEGDVRGLTLQAVDLENAARGMKYHLELLNPKPEEPKPDAVGQAIQREVEGVVNSRLNPQLDRLQATLKEIQEAI